ncbi:MAG: YdcF family protein [Veillonellales bacterium]
MGWSGFDNATMIYCLKVITNFILPPGIFIIVMIYIFLRYYRKREKSRKTLAILVIVVYFLSINYTGAMLLRSLEQRYAPSKQFSGDVVIMLGGGATFNTPDIDGQGNLFGGAANRLLTAVRLYRQFDVPIIVSGGQAFADSACEAVIAKRILLGLGVPEEKIIMEDVSLNTTQNARYVKKILIERGFKRPILVTSAYHMERAVLNFRFRGVGVVPFPCDYMISEQKSLHINSFVPSADGLQYLCIFLHEWLGIWALKINAYFGR